MAFDVSSLDALFGPRSVAVVGASADATKIGGRPVDYLRRLGFSGRILPVNPKAAEVQGLPAYASLRAIEGPVDLAIVAVGAPLVRATVEDAAAKGVKALIVFSAGFAEVDAAGAAAQADIVKIARAADMRIVGPNCMGVADVARGVYASFSPVIGMGQAKAGNVAIVSQSGAFGAFAYTLARERGLGLSKWVASGNECDVDVAECIAWLAGDADTSVILAYLEGTKDGRKLMAALEMARAAGKPVVATKVGRTAIGAAAATSHTSALAGEDRVYDAVLRQCGAYRAETVEEFFDVGYAASRAGVAKGGRIGLSTVSGGVGVLMADDSERYGLDVSEMPASAQKAVRELVPFAATRNPLDITGQVTNDPSLMDKAIAAMLGTGGYDLFAGFFAASGLTPHGGEHLVRIAGDIRRTRPDVVTAFCSVFRPEEMCGLDEQGCLAFEDPSRMIRALAALQRIGAALARPAGGDTRPSHSPAGLHIGAGVANEVDALRVLAEAGVPAVSVTLCRTADAAVEAASRAGGLVVAKVVSRDILHKSEAGGVRLRLSDGAAVREAFEAVTSSAQRHDPNARIDGVLIAPMISGGVECILGAQWDPTFGPGVMFGLGGVLVEVLGDVAFRVAPFGREEALAMIRQIRGAAVLDGVRGGPPCDIDALCDALVALSRLAAELGERLETIDVNPFLVRARGEGALALDAVLVTR
jgi:acyl-CoA synthetase (NDP forming)